MKISETKKKELAEGVNECIEAGIFEINTSDSALLLKAASYGKTFLNPSEIDHDVLFLKM